MVWNRVCVLVTISVALTACHMDDDGASADYGQQVQPIVNGTREPLAVDLTDGQQLAIGWLHQAGYPPAPFCTGTIISPRVVATAAHCVEGVSPRQVGFGVGMDTTAPDGVFTVDEVHVHPSLDAALLVLSESAIEAVPGLVPIPANVDTPSSDLIGTPVQAGGYGQTRDPERTGRWFATVYLSRVDPTQVVVDGRGDQGICFGDSGGPVIAEIAPSQVRLLGVESHGDGTCVDIDYLTRLDVIWDDFVEPVVGGEVTVDGCDPLSFEGLCEGEVAEWCQDGYVLRRDCGSLGTSCGLTNESTGFGCVCDVGELGRCDGNIAQWCENGQLRSLNCEARGEACGWAGASFGYFCTRRARCGSDDSEVGRCDGDVHIQCIEERLQTTNCRQQGLTCGDDGGEPGCVEDLEAEVPDGQVDAPEGGDGSTEVDEVELDVDGEPSEGCSAVPGSGGGSGLWMLAVLGLVWRRRR